ncbi:hypothetical protein SISSUDRAFT_1102135 [Sistotremastrum suecicum HHB10207 ss-3]|uniref:Uncharacterized protein n=1 Tax=Sistotremastrum suecicum HHB10207 ss-3 TaxID=1314776 RepID=A0A165WQ23_9AGAM|nr:hypothetical protein SISSUDRAFT_1102135 [Sistotremastrum suecicum HHB10207 ss-3]
MLRRIIALMPAVTGNPAISVKSRLRADILSTHSLACLNRLVTLSRSGSQWTILLTVIVHTQGAFGPMPPTWVMSSITNLLSDAEFLQPIVDSAMTRLCHQLTSQAQTDDIESVPDLSLAQRNRGLYTNAVELSVTTVLKRRLINLRRLFGTTQMPQLVLICEEISGAALETIVEFQGKPTGPRSSLPLKGVTSECSDHPYGASDLNPLSVSRLISLAMADLQKDAAYRLQGATVKDSDDEENVNGFLFMWSQAGFHSLYLSAAQPSAVAVLHRHLHQLTSSFPSNILHMVAEEVAKACIEAVVDFQMRRAGLPTQLTDSKVSSSTRAPVRKPYPRSRRRVKLAEPMPTVFEAVNSDDPVD